MKPFNVTNVDSRSAKLVPTSSIPTNAYVSFSFKNLMCQCIQNRDFNNKFSNQDECMKYYMYLIQKLNSFSAMTVDQLKSSGDSTRCHPVEGENLSLLKSILKLMGMSNDFLKQIEVFHEMTITTSNGRFFGHFLNNVFYILLLDPHHLLYKNLSFYCKNDIICKSYNPWEEIISN